MYYSEGRSAPNILNLLTHQMGSPENQASAVFTELELEKIQIRIRLTERELGKI